MSFNFGNSGGAGNGPRSQGSAAGPPTPPTPPAGWGANGGNAPHGGWGQPPAGPPGQSQPPPPPGGPPQPPGAPGQQGPGAPPTAPQHQPSGVAPASEAKTPIRAGGIHAVGVITLVLMLVVSGIILFRANRVAPASPRVDSAWSDHGGGETKDLTATLRKAGFRCTDATLDNGTYRRMCADYNPENPRSVEFSGQTWDGEVRRAYLTMDASKPENREVAAAAINAVVPPGPERAPALSAFQNGSAEPVEGPWGMAWGLPNGTFAASSEVGTEAPDLPRVPVDANAATAASRAGFTCEKKAILDCERISDDGSVWTLAPAELPDNSAGLTLRVEGASASTQDPRDLFNELMAPNDPQSRAIASWLNAVSTDQGAAGLWRGLVMEYRVHEPIDTVVVSARTTCHFASAKTLGEKPEPTC